MRNPFLRDNQPGGSFLPEDYVARKSENRANLLALGLFGIVMGGVVAAFFVTNRQWLIVREEQRLISTLYTQEASKIEQLKKLEAQKSEMMSKAEVTTTLIEKIPRSVLLSELVTRMPESITLLELELKSHRPKPAPTSAKAAPKVKNLSGGSTASKGKTPAKGAKGKTAEPPKAEPPQAPKIEYTLRLVGVSRQNEEIADYLAALKACTLLEGLELKYIKEATIDRIDMRKFEIECAIRKDADARGLEPLPMLTAEGREMSSADGQEAGKD